MPDVTIDNPRVQIDLPGGSSTTVPTGEQWRVTIATSVFTGVGEINSAPVTSDQKDNVIEVDLFGGDTITADGGRMRIRGYRVD